MHLTLQAGDGGADFAGQAAERHGTGSVHRLLGADQSLDPAFGRADRIGDFRDFRHREGAVHGVHGAQQVAVGDARARRIVRQPALNGRQMAIHLDAQDLQQHRIDVDRHLLDCGRFDGFDGRFDFGRRGLFFQDRFHDRRRWRVRCGVERFLARGQAVGHRLDTGQVERAGRLAQQGAVQRGQHAMRLPDQSDHRRTGGAALVEHAVEHVLDLPTELTQQLGADQPATALERVEDAADRTQALDLVRRFAPGRDQVVKVADFFLELLEEDLADLVVDFLVVEVEAAFGDRQRRPGFGDLPLRGFGCGSIRTCGRALHLAQGGIVGFGRQFRPRLGIGGLDLHIRGDRARRRAARQGLRVVQQLLVGVLEFLVEERRLGLALWRQWPVAQRLQAVAGDREDVVATAALVAQCLQVVLDAGKRVGQRIQLLSARDALALQQFVLGIAANAGQVFGGLRQFQHAQRSAHLVQQARDLDQLLMVPAGLDESDEALAGIAEIGDRLACQRLEQLLSLGRADALRTVRSRARCGFVAQPRDLVVQRGIDVEERAGDIQQHRFAHRHPAIGDRCDDVALAGDHIACHAESEHAERVGNATEGLGLRLQCSHILPAGAQVQVERILDPQHIFLDRGRNGIEQGAVASADTGMGMGQLALVRRGLPVKAEGFAQALQRGVRGRLP